MLEGFQGSGFGFGGSTEEGLSNSTALSLYTPTQAPWRIMGCSKYGKHVSWGLSPVTLIINIVVTSHDPLRRT